MICQTTGQDPVDVVRVRGVLGHLEPESPSSALQTVQTPKCAEKPDFVTF